MTLLELFVAGGRGEIIIIIIGDGLGRGVREGWADRSQRPCLAIPNEGE